MYNVLLHPFLLPKSLQYPLSNPLPECDSTSLYPYYLELKFRQPFLTSQHTHSQRCPTVDSTARNHAPLLEHGHKSSSSRNEIEWTAGTAMDSTKKENRPVASANEMMGKEPPKPPFPEQVVGAATCIA